MTFRPTPLPLAKTLGTVLLLLAGFTAGTPLAAQSIPFSGRDSKVSHGEWYYVGNWPIAEAGQFRQLSGPSTRLIFGWNFDVDGTFIVSDGAKIEMQAGDGEFSVGRNPGSKPVHSVLDISGPGSQIYVPASQQQYLFLGENAPTTLNISQGGSLVFERAMGFWIQADGPNPSPVTINISGAGSRLALPGPSSRSGRIGRHTLGHKPLIALGRGGVMDLGNTDGITGAHDFFFNARITIGNDGTGTNAAGLFRASNFATHLTEWTLDVDPCSKLAVGSTYQITEYVNYNATNGQVWIQDNGAPVRVLNGGLLQRQGYTFRVNYDVELGRNFPGMSQAAKGTVLTVVQAPSGSTGACAPLSTSLASNLDMPFVLTGPGCSPGLYAGTQTLTLPPFTTCTIEHHEMTTYADGTSDTLRDWSDGVTTARRTITTSDSSNVWMARYVKQYLLKFTTPSPGGGSFSGGGYYDAGETATVKAIPNAAGGFIFGGWTGPVANVRSETTTVVMPGQPLTLSATFPQLRTGTTVTVPFVQGRQLTTIKLQATFATNRPPQINVTIPAGTLRFEVDGKVVGSVMVYAPPNPRLTTYQMDYRLPLYSYARPTLPVKVTFVPLQPDLLGSSASGTVRVNMQ